MTPTFTKSFSFLNRVNILIFKRNKQQSGTIKLSENVRFMGVFIKSKSATADHRLNQFGTAVLVWCGKSVKDVKVDRVCRTFA